MCRPIQIWTLAFCCASFVCRICATPAQSSIEITVPLVAYLRTLDEANVLVSPLSISTCFSLILSGARGQTATQISKALSYPDSSRDDVFKAFSSQRVSYNSKHPIGGVAASQFDAPPPALQIANSIWLDRRLTLVPAYQQLIKDILVVVDFQNASSSTALNAWVANHTNNKIESVVTSPAKLPGDMIAVNAVYFKATWSLQFGELLTGLGTFYASQSRQTVVKGDSHFMHQVNYFQYIATASHQVIALPYAGTTIEMLLALPLKAGVEFGVADLANAVGSMARTYIALALPKFEFTAEYSLNDALKSMGMRAPFSAADADFSGLSSSPGLFISKVIHKSFIAVDEFGTEAAAVTAIVMEVTSVQPSPPTPVLFKADHPFVFFLRDRADGTVLFAGNVRKPVPSESSKTPATKADESIWQEKFNTKVNNPSSISASTANMVGWAVVLTVLLIAMVAPE